MDETKILAVMTGGLQSGPRELNLVDPGEGTDLLFEARNVLPRADSDALWREVDALTGKETP